MEHDVGIVTIEVVGEFSSNSLSRGEQSRSLVCLSLDEDKRYAFVRERSTTVRRVFCILKVFFGGKILIRIIGTDLHTNTCLWQIENQDIVTFCHHSPVMADSQRTGISNLFDGKILSFTPTGCLFALDYLEGNIVEVMMR